MEGKRSTSYHTTVPLLYSHICFVAKNHTENWNYRNNAHKKFSQWFCHETQSAKKLHMKTTSKLVPSARIDKYCDDSSVSTEEPQPYKATSDFLDLSDQEPLCYIFSV